MNRALANSLSATAWIAVLVLGLVALNAGRVGPLPGAKMIDRALLCSADCAEMTEVPLPYFGPIRIDAEREMRRFNLRVELGEISNIPYALYVPKAADNVDVTLNGVPIWRHDPSYRPWNAPLLVPISPSAIATGANEIELDLIGAPSEGLILKPIFLGPADALRPVFNGQYFWSVSLARFGLGLMAMLSAACLFIWLRLPSEQQFLWLGISCLSAMIFVAHYGFGITVFGYGVSTWLWTAAASIYPWLILRFLSRFLKNPSIWLEKVQPAVCVVGAVAAILLPPGYSFWIGAVMCLLAAPSAVAVVFVLLQNSKRFTPVDYWVFFGCMSLAVALGIYDLWITIDPVPVRTYHLFHLMPVVMSLACVWLLVSQLIRNLSGYEALTASLNDTLAQKSAELEDSFTALADGKRREAIAEERERIMLDLHDGICGQLVSTLAYMQRNEVGDAKTRRGIEDALRDLALILDSMENHDSLVTLLGMLRTRLEGLLSEHGMEFNWQVHGEPELENAGPSQSLHLARIVQEAITNAIKHTKADTITIYVDDAEIRISDNGDGFDVKKQAAEEKPANGIANMKRRSEAIGVDFTISSGATGTKVALRLRS